MNGLVVFPTFFNFGLNLAIKSSWSEPVSSQYYFCWLYRASPYLAAKNIINLISVLTIWWCPCVESSPVFWKRLLAMTSAFSWQNSISLCPASFWTPRANLPVTPGVSWLPTLGFQFPIMKRTSFLGVGSKRSYPYDHGQFKAGCLHIFFSFFSSSSLVRWVFISPFCK